jgi:hypothetical protein
VSLSTLTRSCLAINPAGDAKADALRAWWDAEGRSLPTVPVGEGLASANGCAPRFLPLSQHSYLADQMKLTASLQPVGEGLASANGCALLGCPSQPAILGFSCLHLSAVRGPESVCAVQCACRLMGSRHSQTVLASAGIMHCVKTRLMCLGPPAQARLRRGQRRARDAGGAAHA